MGWLRAGREWANLVVEGTARGGEQGGGGSDQTMVKEVMKLEEAVWDQTARGSGTRR